MVVLHSNESDEEDNIDNENLLFSSGDEEDEDEDNKDDGSITSGTRSRIPGISGSSPLSIDLDKEQHSIDDYFEDDRKDFSRKRPHALDLTELPTLQTPLEVQQLNKTPTTSKSRPRVAEQPPALNSKRKSAKGRKKRATAADEVDDSRPNSDKTQLQPIQEAKRLQRLKAAAAQKSKNSANMPITTRKQKETAKASEVDDDHLHENDDEDDADPPPMEKRVDDDEVDKITTVNVHARNKAPSPSTVSQSSADKEKDNAGKKKNKRKSTDVSSTTAKSSSKSNDRMEKLQHYMKIADQTTKDIDQMCANQREKDAKVKKDDRLKLVDKLRRKNYELQIARAKDQVFIFSLEEHIDQLQKEALTRVSRSKAAKMRICDEVKDKVVAITKEELWRSTKFMTCKDDLENGTEKVMIFGKFCEGKSVEVQNSFVVTYNTIVKKSLNQQRNYLTAELKKLGFNCFLKKGLPLPPTGVLLACAMRQVLEVNFEKFMWYWTQVLPKVVDSKKWNKEIFYYHTPTLAKMDNADPNSKYLFTVSHEAMICLVWENNWKKWQDQYQFTQVEANKGKAQPNLPGKWTTSDSGQAEWGGWSTEGLQAYNAYKKQIRKAREGRKQEIRELEQKILAMLRAEAGIVADDHEEQLRLARAKKRRLNADKPVEEVRVRRAIATVDEDDEDDEDR